MIPKIDDKPTMLIAGPGAGKTTDMVERIVEAIPELRPNRVLAAIFIIQKSRTVDALELQGSHPVHRVEPSLCLFDSLRIYWFPLRKSGGGKLFGQILYHTRLPKGHIYLHNILGQLCTFGKRAQDKNFVVAGFS